MNDMAIDGEIVELFKNWRLPKLQNLVLFANFIDDEAVIKWLTL